MHALSGDRTTNAAAVNFLAASSMLKLAQLGEEGNFYSSMASIVFSAFTYEAFLNIAGEEVIPPTEWEKIERAGWRRKQAALFKVLSVPIDMDTRPGSTLDEIFEFRNRMAHGREETKEVNGVTVADLRPLTIQEATSTDWERKCSPEFAARAFCDVRDVGFIIAKAMNRPVYGSNPFGIPSWGGFGARTS
ncbi:MAG: hypothetical protein WDZ63_04445 [Burkholderiales bacterium]